MLRSVGQNQVSTVESFNGLYYFTLCMISAGQATNVGGHFSETFGDPRLAV